MAEVKEYILSVEAKLKGHKVVISGVRELEGVQSNFKKTIDLSTKSTQSFSDVLANAGKRALLVAPIWMAIRTVMMGMIKTTTDIIQSNIKFESSMAEVRTMVTGTGAEIESQMATAKKAILDTASDSRISLSDLTDAFRFLQSANLSFQETMAGFPVVSSLMNAFGLSAQEASRAVAGMYNTAKSKLEGLTTANEKFAKIGDVLAYTYVKQDVLVGELIQSYANFAPYIGEVNDDFTTIITTLGFLNTLMLRSGKTGTVTGRAILEIVKSADQLAEVFGITFDQNKPLTFINTLEKINQKLQAGHQLTMRESQALQEVFEVRAGVPVKLLESNFGALIDAIQDATKNADGYLKKIEEIRKNTVEAQLSRTTNLLTILGNEFISGATSGETFATQLKNINDNLETIRQPLFELGIDFGSWNDKIKAVIRSLILLDTIASGGLKIVMGKMSPEERAKALADALLEAIDIIETLTQTEEERRQRTKQREKELQQDQKTLQEADNKRKSENEQTLNFLKQQKTELESQANLMKIFGASSLQYEIQKLQLAKERQATEQEIYEQTAKVYETALKMLTTEQNKVSDLMVEYKKADEFKRGQLRRVFELTALPSEDLVDQFQESAYDQTLILDYWDRFSEAGQRAIGKVLAEEQNFEFPTMETVLSADTEAYKQASEELRDSIKELNNSVIDLINVQLGGEQALNNIKQTRMAEITTQPLGSTTTGTGNLMFGKNAYDEKYQTQLNMANRENEEYQQSQRKQFLIDKLSDDPIYRKNYQKLVHEKYLKLQGNLGIDIDFSPEALQELAEEAGKIVINEITSNVNLQKKVFSRAGDIIKTK